MKILTKKCIVCGQKFTKPSSCSLIDWFGGKKRPDGRRFCSKSCSAKFTQNGLKTRFKKGQKALNPIKKGKHLSVKTEFKKGQKVWNKDRHWTKKERQKIANGLPKRFAEKSSMWKGDNAGYYAKHIWLVQKYGHAKECEHCRVKGKYIYLKNGRKRWSIDWANRTGIYTRKIEDYIGLCRICHNRYDKGIIDI